MLQESSPEKESALGVEERRKAWGKKEKKEREEAGKARLSSFFQSEKGKANESKQSSGSKARNGGLKANEARQWLGFRSMLWRMEAQISRCPLDSVIV